MIEIILTDPTRKGTIEFNGELVIFTCECRFASDIIKEDQYNLYVNGELRN